MSTYSFNYAFNISGNCNAVVEEISGNVERLRERVGQTAGALTGLEKTLLVFNQAQQYCSSLGQALESTLAPGGALESQLADLEAIAGVTAEEYATLEKYARSSAKEFGVSAASSVNSYKLLLSQLSPELTKNSKALNSMGNNVAVLSKMMGGDTTAASEVLTTAMNQYGVSLDDATAASDRMWEMMNTMAAAAREGSAELPSIKVALEQCGMAAKSAGVSFEETNAAIQVLDKAGKKGSEGGVALRNVMTTLAQGRFLPKDVREELSAAGISIESLTDKSKSLAERLAVLKPVMADDALFSKLFGKENSAAAMALVQGIPKVRQWTEAITGTTTAIDQADIVMGTYNERLARIQSRFDDFKISIFKCSGELGIWTKVVASSLTPLAQLVPLVYSAAKAIAFLRTVNFRGAFVGVVSSIRNVCAGLVLMNASITASGGYWLAFKAVATNVCRSIGIAIMNIPIIGWIAAGIAIVIAVIQQLWDKCYSFRVAVFTAWEGIKAIFAYARALISDIANKIGEFALGVWDGVKSLVQKAADIFMAVVNKIRSWIMAARDFVVRIITAIIGAVSTICKPLAAAFRNVANAVKGFFSGVINWVRDKFYTLINWFIDKYNYLAAKLNFAKIARLGREAADRSWAADHPGQPEDGGGLPTDAAAGGIPAAGASPIGGAIAGVSGTANKDSGGARHINIYIDKMIDKFTISTTNLKESREHLKEVVVETLLSAVNDVNLAF